MLTVLTANGPSGYSIANSLRFRASASAYLARTITVNGNSQTWTYSVWLKRGSLGAVQYGFLNSRLDGNNNVALSFQADDTIQFIAFNSGSQVFQLYTTQVFRDASAWYHFVFVCDTTQATASNRVKIYVNGSQITAFSTAAYPTQNATTYMSQTSSTHNIGRWPFPIGYFDGYLTEINFIDGQALTPSSFGEIDSTTGVWKAKRYTGTYGTNGFRLNFSNGTSTTTLGYDSSGNGNNWTTNNVSLTAGSTYDWMIDSPTKFPGSSYGVGNYAVLNPLEGSGKSNGNLSLAGQTSGNSTIQVSSGKWYAEYVIGSTLDAYIGVARANTSSVPVAYRQDGTRYTGSAWVAYGASYSAGDVISIAFDLDVGTAQFFKNNTSQGVISGVSYSTVCGVTVYVTTSNSCVVNFGQRPFAYTPPSGYKSLCTQNLPGVTIQNGAQYMAATLYTGTGSSVSISNAVNGVGFQPDFVWGKLRTTSSYHRLSDSVRGASLTLATNVTDAEVSGNGLVSFDASGFSMNSSTNINQVYPYVAWQWKANGTAVTNTAGSITSSVSANTTAGFSVVTYTGNGTASTQTIGHGLGTTLSMLILKGRASSGDMNWGVSHTSIAAPNYLLLNSTGQADNYGPGQGQPSIGTGNTFKVLLGTTGTTNYNTNGATYVAYCFAAIPGYSAFGSYTGNGSADGPFVYCGFRPRYLMVKRTDSTGAWEIYDTSRSPYNVTGAKDLQADSASAEGASGISLGYDILSNGFKNRDTTSYLNASGGTYIYACFAESPFQLSLAR